MDESLDLPISRIFVSMNEVSSSNLVSSSTNVPEIACFERFQELISAEISLLHQAGQSLPVGSPMISEVSCSHMGSRYPCRFLVLLIDLFIISGYNDSVRSGLPETGAAIPQLRCPGGQKGALP